MTKKMSARALGRALSFPGIDPSSYVLQGRIVNEPDAVRMDTDDNCMYADIEISGKDVDHDGEHDVLPEITARISFQMDGSGAIFYPGIPKPGTPVVVFIPNGTVDNDVYAMCVNSSKCRLPKSVISNQNDMHIVAPQGQVIRIGSRQDGAEKNAARVDDEITISDDPVVGFLNKLLAVYNTAQAAGSPMLPAIPSGISSIPGITSVKGKISKGSSRVKIGGTSA